MGILGQLQQGEIVSVGNKMYAKCGTCNKLVQINKGLFGSMHVCNPIESPAEEKFKYNDNQYEERVLSECGRIIIKVDKGIPVTLKGVQDLKVGEQAYTFNPDGTLYGVCGSVYATQVETSRQLEFKSDSLETV